MKIKLLKSFNSKFNSQIDYIAKDKPLAARKFKQDVIQKIQSLNEYPYKYKGLSILRTKRLGI